jgi:hypothetical protein
MAYPLIAAPYGLKPINLIGGQVFAGSTRELPIQYGYNANIFYGDFVKLAPYSSGSTPGGFIVRAAVSTGTANNQVTGVFLGCSFTNPITKQKQFQQFWPSGTLAGDAVAIVCDDPDTVFKAVVCSSTTVVASGSKGMVGANLSMIDNGAVNSSLSTGNSANAVLAPTATPVTTILPVRCVGLVPDTAVTYSAVATSASSTTTINAIAPAALPVGTNISYVAPNGQIIDTGMFLTSAATAGSATQTMSAQPVVLGVNTNIPSGATINYTVYPEILVKVNLFVHGYYSSTAV